MTTAGCALTLSIALVVVPGALWAVSEPKAGPAPIVARITLVNGDSRTVSLVGIGCSKELCSRVAIRSRGEGDSQATRTSLDTIAAIKDITDDGARFVFKDGREWRQSIVSDNRFMYFVNQNGGETKIDLSRIDSIEFLGTARSNP